MEQFSLVHLKNRNELMLLGGYYRFYYDDDNNDWDHRGLDGIYIFDLNKFKCTWS